MKAIKIDTDGNATILADTELETLQQAVGGYIEGVYCADARGGFLVYLNEDGKMLGLPLNRRVTRMFGRQLCAGDFVVGTAVIVGPDEDADIPEWLVKDLGLDNQA